MPSNMLAGAGPMAQGAGGNADGPMLSSQGQNGATPQAAPNQPQAPNMLAGGAPAAGGLPRPGAAPAPLVPPPLPKLIEALHKTSYINSTLKALLNKPDLQTKDILNEVGEAVANGVMGPFDAANELKSLPSTGESLALRQWVGQHYATSAQHLATIAEMVQAHGHMVRRGGGAPPPNMPPQISNAFQGA